MPTKNRIFTDDLPVSVMQNLVTALDPALLTETTLMLLFHDLSRLLPIEELPHRLLTVMTDYFSNDNDDDESDEVPPPH